MSTSIARAGGLAAAIAIGACAAPLRLDTAHERQVAVTTLEDRVTVTDTATVQVRYYAACSPFVTLGWRMTDDLLRAGRDSLVMEFHGRHGRTMSIAVPRALIDACLTVVDSVSASLRKSN